jgi:hypothetical protein
MERVRVRQGEGEIPLSLTLSHQGRENYKESGYWYFGL